MKNSISIIVPAYKEEQFIENTLRENIKALRKDNFEFEVITVIDKVPNDKTFEIVEQLSKSFDEIKIIAREGKQGIASAIKEGITYASKDIIIILMGDKSEDPNDLPKLIFKMNEGYDMVFGNRFSSDARFEGYPMKKYILNRMCNFAIRILFGIRSSDITNAVKAYRATILKKINITSSGFEVFAELPIKAYLRGYKNFAEVPLNHYSRDITFSKFNIFDEGPRYFKIVFSCRFNKDHVSTSNLH